MQRRTIIARSLIAITLLFVVGAVGGYFYLRSASFQRFAIGKIVQQANLVTGGKVEVSAIDFDLSTLTAHMRNITVRGTEGSNDPPLLYADELTVSVKIISAFRRQLSLRELALVHPVIHLQVNRKGNNNLPSAPPSRTGSHISVFDLAVEHAQITNGEVDYNDQKTPVEANLYNLETDIRFVRPDRYDGRFSYENGTVSYAQYDPLPHSLKLAFTATPERFELQSATFKIGRSTAILHASLLDYSNPVADGDYHLQIHIQDFAAMSPAVAPAGDVMLNGRLQYQTMQDKSLLRSISVKGQVASDALSAVSSGARVDLQHLQASYELAGGNLRVTDFKVESFGGRIAASATLNHLDATAEATIRADLQNISLKALQQSMRRQAIPGAVLLGTINGKAEAAWKGSLDNVHAQSDLVVNALATSESNPVANDVPVEGIIHASYDAGHQSIALRETTLRIPTATLSATGEVSDRSNLHLHLAANDLHQLALLAASFAGKQTAAPAISGSATLNATIRGSMTKPAIAAQLNAQNLQFEGSEWKSASVQLQANPSSVTVQNGSLVNAHRGHAYFSATIGLKDWSYEPSNPISAHLDVQQMSIVDLQCLANRKFPISGDLSAKLSLQGSQLHPEGSGSAQLANALAYGEPIQNLSMKFQAANGSVDSTLNVALAAGTVNADLSFTPETKAYRIKLDAPSLVLQKLQTLPAKNVPVSGTLTASVSGAGTLADPQLNVVLQLSQLQIRQNSISDIKADVRVAEHLAELNLDSNVSQAAIRAHGRVALTGDYQTDATIDTGIIPLDAVMATYAPSVPAGFQGQAELHATLKGPLNDTSKIEAHLSIPVFKASYQALQIGITSPIRADYADSVVTLQSAEIKGTDTSLRMQGSMPISGAASPTLSAQGSVDVRILQIFEPTLKSSGMLALDVRATGSSAHPQVRGQVQLKDISMSTADVPVGVEKLNGTLEIANDRVQLSNMSGHVGGGDVSVGGSISYRPNVQFNLVLQGKSVRLRYPDGLRSILDANLAFSGTSEASTLNGRVLIDGLSFTPDFDLSKFADQISAGNSLSQPGLADTIKLAIAVQSRDNLNAASSQITIEGQAALNVGGTAANPVITGRTTLTSGELFYRNVRYQLQTGIITFDNPTETHPVLNLSVSTTVEQYNLTLTMRGPLDKLMTSYVSDPPLATADVINLIARGQTTQEAAANSQSTDSMIAAQAAGQLASGLQNLVGISSLQIDPSMSGNGQNTSTQIAIQQRVTKNFLFTFSTDVSQPGTETVGGEYQINKRWSVSATRDQLGGFSVDGRYHTRF